MFHRFDRFELDGRLLELRRDGIPLPVEPQVFALIAYLVENRDRVVSKDELIEKIWNGRFVSDAAVASRIKTARQLLGDDGKSQRFIRTTHGRGFRFVGDVDDHGLHALQDSEVAVAATPIAQLARPHVSRRGLIASAAAIGAAVVAGGLFLRSREDSPPSDVAPLIERAGIALQQGDEEGNNQAIGLYRRVVALHPTYARGWSALAEAYAFQAHRRPESEIREIQARTRDAAGRALSLDPKDAHARLALALVQPRIGHWAEVERAARAGMDSNPQDALFPYVLGNDLLQVGRMGEAAAAFERASRYKGFAPVLNYERARALWMAGRLEDADRAMSEAFNLFPTHPGVWFAKADMLLYGGRPGEALTFIENEARRPSGVGSKSFDLLALAAKAMMSAAPADIAKALQIHLMAAHAGSGAAVSAIKFASAIGRVDDALAVAEAYLFDRGFSVSSIKYSSTEGTYMRREDRSTYVFFHPATLLMRQDRRFAALTREAGFEHYWRASGSRPDYRRL
jgi:DNA-binding winged helix-turn-helix (wHTH) protein/predicted Zn-dependent protease